MTRDEALQAIEARVQNRNLIKHMLATESIMRALARRLGEEEDEWGLTGLLHDIDVELAGDDPARHSRLAADLARELGASDKMCRAILCHNEAHGVPCETALDKALFCADPLTGLVIAGALVRPDRKIAGLEVKSLMKRFKDKRFAAGAKREQIALCSEIQLELEEFVALGIEAMKEISDDLEL